MAQRRVMELYRCIWHFLPRSLRALCRLAWTSVLTFGLFASPCCCAAEKHELSADEMEGAAKQLAFAEPRVAGVELILDTSGSMRGFALAANANQADAADPWQSVYVGIDSLINHLALAGLLVSPTAAQHGPSISLLRFGGSLEALSPAFDLVSLALGRQRPPPPMRGTQLSAGWRSRSCVTEPPLNAQVRESIDSLFSEHETCLSLPFDHAEDPRGGRLLHLILTDAEQAVPEGTQACPSSRNLAPIQERLYSWVHNENRFAAIVVFRLPNKGWRGSRAGLDFCHCRQRNLFLYLLAPSAEVAEAAYAQIAAHWRGAADEIAYLPLAQRPASQFAVKMTVFKSRDGDLTAGAQEQFRSLLNPREGSLPIFSVTLKETEALVRFDLSDLAFEREDLRRSPGAPAVSATSRDLVWRQRPLLVRATARAQAGPGREDRELHVAEDSGAYEIRQVSDQRRGQAGLVRSGAYFGTPSRASAGSAPEQVDGSLWSIRRLPGSRCQLYVFEIFSSGRTALDKVVLASPLLRHNDPQCTNVGGIAAQVRHVFSEVPVARFLLHIDS